jgi:ABC-type polysaccharide/polyol phosphate export permease
MSRIHPSRPDLNFFRNLVRRQIRQDYLENVTGFAWLVLQPLVLLGVYAFVFTTIFKSRIPDSRHCVLAVDGVLGRSSEGQSCD